MSVNLRVSQIFFTLLCVFGLSASSWASVFAYGDPGYDSAKDSGVFLWKNNDGSWSLRAAAGNTSKNVFLNFVGNISTSEPIERLNKVALEPNDIAVLSTETNIDFDLKMKKGFEDGFDFSVASDETACINVTHGTDHIWVGELREKVPLPFNLNTFLPCGENSASSYYAGRPLSYDAGAYSGISLWQEANGSWTVMATAGEAVNNEFEHYLGKVVTDGWITSVTPISFEPSDVSEITAENEISFAMAMKRHYDDGFNFTVSEGASVCLELEEDSNFVIGFDSQAADQVRGQTSFVVSNPIRLNAFNSCVPSPQDLPFELTTQFPASLLNDAYIEIYMDIKNVTSERIFIEMHNLGLFEIYVRDPNGNIVSTWSGSNGLLIGQAFSERSILPGETLRVGGGFYPTGRNGAILPPGRYRFMIYAGKEKSTSALVAAEKEITLQY